MTDRVPAIVLAMILLSSCSSAPPVATQGNPADVVATPTPIPVSADLDSPIPLDEAFRHGRLDNGLTWYVRTNPEPQNRAELRLAVNAGSLQEDDDQRGLAHFVEHMAFNGTENFEKQELVDQLERLGMAFGADINAYTSFDETVYKLEVPTDDPDIMNTAFRILRDWAQGIAFEGEEIDKERGVVIEEWRLRRGAGARIRDLQLPITYHGSRYAERMVIGNKETLETAPHDVLRRFYRDWYRPELMAVVAVGDFENEEIIDRIKSVFGGLSNPPSPRSRDEYPIPDHEQTLISIVTDPEATSTRVSVGFKRPKIELTTVGDLRGALVDGLYDGMMMNRLEELTQKPEPPYRFAYAASGGLGRTKSMYNLFAAVDDGGVERGLTTLLTEARRVERFGFLNSELARFKVDFKRFMERQYLERNKVKSRNHATEAVSNFLEGEPMPSAEWVYQELIPLVDGISLAEINDRADQWLSEGNRVILVSGPEEQAASLPSEDRLLELFTSVLALEVMPWVDQVRDEPLVASPPSAGTIVEEELIPEMDLTRWVLSNGVEVWLKPTEFKNDQVLMSAWSPGGYSLVPDTDSWSARVASSLLPEMGLGNFSRIELDKALSGKVAGVRSGVNELSEWLAGSASPSDLETLFQLVWLRVTEPRLDEDAAAAYLERMRGSLAHREASPSFQFGQKFNQVVTQDHPRRRLLTSGQLGEIDVHRALEVYRDRFADTSDFIFVFVGTFDVETIRPFVESWIAALPVTGREETWRDLGVKFPAEPVTFNVEAGIEPKSSVRLRLHGKAEWTPLESHLLASMAQALRIRLREVLREDLGGVYGVGVSAWISREPRQEFTVSINFGCSPDRVDELLEAVATEMENFVSVGPDENTVAKVRENQIREWEVDQRENGFWLQAIANRARWNRDPRTILEEPDLTEAVTVETLKDVAGRYLTAGQRVQGVLYPDGEVESNDAPEGAVGSVASR